MTPSRWFARPSAHPTCTPWVWMQQGKHHQTPGMHHSGHRNAWQGTHPITILHIWAPWTDPDRTPIMWLTWSLHSSCQQSSTTVWPDQDFAGSLQHAQYHNPWCGTPENFEGEYNIVTDPNVQPVQHAMKKTPIKYQDKIEKELDWMVEQGIIAPVTKPTEWVNLMTYPVKPNGDLHNCLDPKDLNKAIMWEYYKLPTLEKSHTNWVEQLSSPCLMLTRDSLPTDSTTNPVWKLLLTQPLDVADITTCACQ